MSRVAPADDSTHPPDAIKWMRDAGFTLTPWQERLAEQVFAEPRRTIVLAEPYRNGRREHMATTRDARSLLPRRTRLRLAFTRVIDKTAISLVDHGHYDAALRLWQLTGLLHQKAHRLWHHTPRKNR
jgi:hypothetical protein